MACWSISETADLRILHTEVSVVSDSSVGGNVLIKEVKGN